MQRAMPRGGEFPALAFFVDVLGMAEIVKPPVLAAGRGSVARDPFGNRLEILQPEEPP